MSIRTIIGIVVMALSLIPGFYYLYKINCIKKRFTKAEATVTRSVEGWHDNTNSGDDNVSDRYYWITIEFNANGSPQNLKRKWDTTMGREKDIPQAGSMVTIYYNPINPLEIYFPNYMSKMPAMAFVIGILVGIIILAFFVIQ
jgi:hypothetical protein